MFAETKLTINFTNTTAAKEAKEIASKTLLTMEYDFSFRNAAENAAANLIAENNSLVLPEEHGAFSPEEWNDILTEILKGITTELPNENFTYTSCAYSNYSEAWIEGNYANGTLEINSTYYPMGYLEYVECPECGEEVVRIDEYDPNKTYICPDCGEEIDLSERYKECAPVITKETIEIK